MNIQENLISRNFNPMLYSGVVVDAENDIMTVMMYTLTGANIGYQQYRPNASKTKKNNPREGRYFTYINSSYIPIWGVETLSMAEGVVVVVEGIFDACQFHNFGIPAIATFGSYSNQLRNWLYCLGRKVYTVNDSKGVNNKLNCFENISLPEGRDDVGECSETEVYEMVKQIWNRLNG